MAEGRAEPPLEEAAGRVTRLVVEEEETAAVAAARAGGRNANRATPRDHDFN